MAYQRYNLSTTPPPIYTSDGYFTSSYNPYLSHEPKYQIAGQGTQTAVPATMGVPQVMAPMPSSQVVTQPSQMVTQPSQVVAQPAQVVAPTMMTMPSQMISTTPQMIAQPMMVSAPMPQPFVQTNLTQTKAELASEPKGWTLINIILVLLLLLSCLTSIVNLLDGDIPSAIFGIFCLCIFYWIYSNYNHNESEH